MKHLYLLCTSALTFVLLAASSAADETKGHHHHHHHKGHHKHHKHHKHSKHHDAAKVAAEKVAETAKPVALPKPATVVKAAVATQATRQNTEQHTNKSSAAVKKEVGEQSTNKSSAVSKDHPWEHFEGRAESNSIVEKMRKLETKLSAKAKAMTKKLTQGHILVNGPVPADFAQRFSKAVSEATGVDATTVKVTDTTAVQGVDGVVEVNFVASPKAVKAVESDAADPDSKLANGQLHTFLVKEDDDDAKAPPPAPPAPPGLMGSADKDAVPVEDGGAETEATPIEHEGIDIDTAMPYGDLEPFGREDTAQELTESSVKESDQMVDQLERAEVAEEKRAVFRALTRLRGAAITSFDGVARSQTGNIDEYNKVHQWRRTHPLHHLADEESDVAKWAFPDNADF